MKMMEFLELSKEEINKLLIEIAEKIKEKSGRECIGWGWEYDPTDPIVTIRLRFRHVYLEVERYKKFIDAVYQICEEYGFDKDTVFIEFEYNRMNLIGYVDVDIELRGEEE